MRPNKLIMALLFALLFLLSNNAFSVGQIAGRSDEQVRLETLYINKQPFRESGEKILIYKDLLEGGRIFITGKDVSDKGNIVSVEISIDGGKKWGKAKLSKKGAFEYSFRPKPSGSYSIYVKATDLTGASNDIASAHKEITISEKTTRSAIQETLDAMVDAYQSKNIYLFMSFIRDDFFYDKEILDSGIRRGFSEFHDIDIRYILNSVVPDYRDKIFVSVTFNRRYTEIKTGKTLTDTGSTAFVFKIKDGKLKILSMTKPLMFFYQ